jgi:Seryl-tRNA synthetase
MIDIKLIRQDPERFKRGAQAKRIACDIDELLALDDRRRAAQTELDRLKHEQNETGAQIANYRNPRSKYFQAALASGRTEADLKAEADALVERMTAIKNRVRELGGGIAGGDRAVRGRDAAGAAASGRRGADRAG